MGDFGVVVVSAIVGVALAIIAKIRCRHVVMVDANGVESYIDACGFSDQPIVPESMVEEVHPRPGSVLLMKRQN